MFTGGFARLVSIRDVVINRAHASAGDGRGGGRRPHGVGRGHGGGARHHLPVQLPRVRGRQVAVPEGGARRDVRPARCRRTAAGHAVTGRPRAAIQ